MADSMPETRRCSRSVFLTIALALAGLAGAETTLWLAYHYAPVQITAGSLWVVAPDAGGSPISLYESYRIFFVHLPAAYATAACCGLMAIGGVFSLLTKKQGWDTLTVSAAETGLLCGAIVLLTGSFWADFAWGSGKIGSGWNWEPRLTTTLILWLAFAALLVLRRSVDNPRQRRVVTAVYGILAAPLYPLVQKAIEIGQTSHPRSFSSLLSAPEIAATKQVASVGVALALLSVAALRFAWNRLQERIEQEKAS